MSLVRGGAAVAVVAVVLLAACTPPGPSPTASPTTPVTASPTEGTPSSSPTETIAAPTSTAGSACSTDDLELSVGPVDAGAGQRYVPVVMVNDSDSPCTLEGYPQVVAVDAGGTVLAVATPEETTPPGTVVLAPGEAASALVHAVAVPSGDVPCPADSAALRVTPPGASDAAEVDVVLPTCPGLAVRAVVAGEAGM